MGIPTFSEKLQVLIGYTSSINPTLFAMVNNISLGVPDNCPSSVLDFLNDDFELDEAQYLSMLDYQLDEQGELQSIIAFINNLSDVDEGSGEELKEPTPKSVKTPLVHRRDLVTGALIPMTPM